MTILQNDQWLLRRLHSSKFLTLFHSSCKPLLDRADLKYLTKQQIDSLKNISVILVREEYKATYSDLKSYEESHLVDGNCGIVPTGQPGIGTPPIMPTLGTSNINLTTFFHHAELFG